MRRGCALLSMQASTGRWPKAQAAGDMGALRTGGAAQSVPEYERRPPPQGRPGGAHGHDMGFA